MPTWVRLASRYGNGCLVLLFSIFTLTGLGKGQSGFALMAAAVAALGIFNIYVNSKSARLLSEEEWLAAEIRKAELRRQLAALQAGTAAPMQNTNRTAGRPVPQLAHDPGST